MNYKEKLEQQIKEQYGKVVYSFAGHWEEVEILKTINNTLKWLGIIISATSATGMITYLIFDQMKLGIVGALFSTISLALNLFTKEYDIDGKIIKHQMTANDLWLLREEYLSLLTDIDEKDKKTIVKERDTLILESSKIYKTALPIGRSAYRKACRKIKEGYQYFSDEELNMMLPKHLRK